MQSPQFYCLGNKPLYIYWIFIVNFRKGLQITKELSKECPDQANQHIINISGIANVLYNETANEVTIS